LFGLLLANTVYVIYLLATAFSVASVFAAVSLAALILAAFYAREFALRDQDRIIRLEERLRMGRLFADELKPSIESLTTSQLIGLRFASDAELVELTRKVIAEGINDGKEIKALIKTWRPDHHRV
jgi:hypothetical protein